MVAETQCLTNAAECKRLSTAGGISNQRATALMAMTYSWDQLAGQKKGYDAIVFEESISH
jgi:hypothetical protein